MKSFSLNMKHGCAFIFVLMLALTSRLSATTYYVATDGVDTNDGLSEETPLALISTALGKADVTEIVVAAGTYLQTATLSLDKGITLRGATGIPADVIIDGGENYDASKGIGTLVSIDHADAILKDLRLTRGGAEKTNIGGGVHFTKGGTVQNCVIDTCGVQGGSSISGIGVYLAAGGTVTDCVISNCHSRLLSSNSGVAIYIKGNSTLKNSLVCGAHRPYKGDTIYDTEGAVYLTSGSIIGCTIAGNTLSHAALKVADSADCLVRDTIVWGNTVSCDSGTGRPNVSIGANAVVQNLCTSAAFGENPIVRNPCFANETDYSLLPGSPCIGAGTDGRDLGYIPFDTTKDALGFDFNVTEGVDSLEATVTLKASGSYSLDGATVTWTEPADVSGISFTKTFGPGRYALAATVTFSDGTTASARLENAVVVKASGVMYVDAASTNPISPYATPETAAKTLEDALDLMADGLTVYVKKGTYKPGKVFLLADAVKIIGLDAREETIIDAQDKHRHFTICHKDALIAGLWLEDGHASRGGGSVYIGGEGGTVSNCVINSAGTDVNVASGRGIRMSSVGALVTHSTIMNCESGSFGNGCGVLLDYGTLANSLVISNALKVTDSKSLGGGVYMSTATDDAKIINCTIAHNGANKGGGIYRAANAGFVVNTIVYDNTTANDAIDDIYADEGTARPIKTSFLNTCTSTEIGTNCQVAPSSPYELPTYQLSASASSLCIDAGTNEVVEVLLTTDITGETPRIANGIVDIGAYEYKSSGVEPSITESAVTALSGSEVTFEAGVLGADASACTYAWYVGASDEQVGEGAIFRISNLPLGEQTVRLVITYNGQTYSTTKTVVIFPTDVYVAVDGNHIYPYATPETAATNIEDAVALQMDGMRLHVGAGSFSITNALEITTGLILTGAGMDQTIIYRSEKKAASRIFEINAAEAFVRCLTASNGCLSISEHGCNVRISGNGGTIEDCRITGGYNGGAVNIRIVGGGGIYLSGANSICRRCDIVNNRTALSKKADSADTYYLRENGGGAYVTSGARLESCLVRGNAGNAYGGGVYSDGGHVRNCTIVGNQSRQYEELASGSFGAGLYAVDGGSAVNNIVVGNSVTNVVDNTIVLNEDCGGTMTLFKSTCTTAEIGENCVTDDPLFMGEGDPLALTTAAMKAYRLSGNSPCRKVGVYQDWMEKETDFFGNPRFVGTLNRKVDIGFYQSSANGFSIIVR